MAIKAVIFDLDGTIVSFNLDYKSVRAEVREVLIRARIPTSLFSANESIFEMLNKMEIFVMNSRKSPNEVKAIRNEVLVIADKYELEAAKKTDLLPGVIEVLKTLKQMGLKLGLFTLSGEKSVKYILHKFKLSDLFGITIPRNKVNLVKPNPEHLEMAIRVLGEAPTNTVVVGDSKLDMQCAKELKAIGVGLPMGVSTIKQLMKNGANYIITSITDLPILIEKISAAQVT